MTASTTPCALVLKKVPMFPKMLMSSALCFAAPSADFLGQMCNMPPSVHGSLRFVTNRFDIAVGQQGEFRAVHLCSTCGDIGLDVRSGDLSVAPGVTASPSHSGLHHWRRATVTERFCARDLVGARCCPDGFRYWVRVNLGTGRFRDNRLR